MTINYFSDSTALQKVVSDNLISIARLECQNVVCTVYFCMLQDRSGLVVLGLLMMYTFDLNGNICIETDRQTDRQIDRQTDRQTRYRQIGSAIANRQHISIIPVTILLPSAIIEKALHVMFGTTMRNSSFLVSESQMRKSFCELVANNSEQSLQHDTHKLTQTHTQTTGH